MLPPALSPPCSPPAPLSCVPHGNVVSVFPLPSGSPAVIPSSSVSDSSKSPSLPPLHPLLASLLSPRPSLSWRSPLSPSLPTCASRPCLPRSVSAVILPYAIVLLLSVSTSHRGRPAAYPFQLLSPDLLPPSSRGPLQPLAPPLAPLPPAPAANIVRRDEDVGDQTGGVVALRSVAGRSAPCGKIPSRPHAVVEDGISRPLFLHLP